MKEIDLDLLSEFLVEAKTKTYASLKSKEIKPERPEHKELEFEKKPFYYRDSYVGFFQAPGMEEVRFGKNGKTIWTMAYSGGMEERYLNDENFAKETFNFLKEALSLIDKKMPYRGPKKFKKQNWKYLNIIEGDIKRFFGKEKILYKGKKVFSQEYIGGIVINKK